MRHRQPGPPRLGRLPQIRPARVGQVVAAGGALAVAVTAGGLVLLGPQADSESGTTSGPTRRTSAHTTPVATGASPSDLVTRHDPTAPKPAKTSKPHARTDSTLSAAPQPASTTSPAAPATTASASVTGSATPSPLRVSAKAGAPLSSATSLLVPSTSAAAPSTTASSPTSTTTTSGTTSTTGSPSAGATSTPSDSPSSAAPSPTSSPSRGPGLGPAQGLLSKVLDGSAG